jgi:hypothetical protein
MPCCSQRTAGYIGGAWLLAACLVLPGGPGLQAVEVGVAAAVNRDAFGTPPGQGRTTKILGDNVIYNERIETGGSGLVQVLLVDGSTFTVGANSDLVIDEFVYDPGAGTGKLVATFSKGVARFVGGKLSKNRGGVTVQTPVGTIGIRGGIANLNLAGDPPVFSLLFGKDLTFTGPDGRRARVHQAGYSLELGTGGGPRVRRTTQGDLGSVQSAMTSRGQSGGIGRPPGDDEIAGSGFAQVNSALGLIGTTPRRKPSPVQSTRPEGVDDVLVQTPVLTQLGNTASLEDPASVVTDKARILRAGTTFNGTAARNLKPGDLGVVGGSSGFDKIVVFSRDADEETDTYRLWSGTADGTSIYVFDPDDTANEYFTQTVNADGDIIESRSTSAIPDAPELSGTIVQNARGQRITGEGFGFFVHFVATTPGADPAFNYGGTDYFYGLYGDATDFDDFDGTEAEKLRTYTLHGDVLTAFQLASEDNFGLLRPATSSALFLNPSIAEDLGATFLKDVKTTGLKVLEKTSDTLDGARYAAASMLVSGDGSSQVSFLSLSLGDIGESDGTLVLEGERRGGHRTEADNSSGLYGGGIESLEGGTGGTIFGDNANHMLLGPKDLASGGTYTDGYVEVPSGISATDQMSGTMHAAELASETAVSGLDRSTRTLTGFAAGVLESNVNYAAPSLGPLIFNSASVGDFEVSFDAGNGSLYATMSLEDQSDVSRDVFSYQLAFGEQSGSGQSVFIDDDTFAAIETAGGSGNTMTTRTNATISPKPGTTPQSYLVSNTLVNGADAGVFDAATRCTCAFLEWGYWGTKLEAKDARLEDGDRYDTFHLGTWVAGKVTASASLPTTGSATYTGHAVGNVVNNGAQYLASGDFSMSVNFADRFGSATISNFDDRTMTATLTETTVSSGNLFEGALSGVGGLSGSINTSVVAGPNSNHQGVIGDFSASQGTWSATGIVAGEKD